MSKSYSGEVGQVYEVPYAWYSVCGGPVYCAWCNKPKDAIKNPNAHINYHIRKNRKKATL